MAMQLGKQNQIDGREKDVKLGIYVMNGTILRTRAQKREALEISGTGSRRVEG